MPEKNLLSWCVFQGTGWCGFLMCLGCVAEKKEFHFAHLSIFHLPLISPTGRVHGVQQGPALCPGTFHLTGRNCVMHCVTGRNCMTLGVGLPCDPGRNCLC